MFDMLMWVQIYDHKKVDLILRYVLITTMLCTGIFGLYNSSSIEEAFN